MHDTLAQQRYRLLKTSPVSGLTKWMRVHACDKLAPREILFRVRGRIVDNPALDTQARVRAMEENRGHPISSARGRKLLLT
jgi:hypothetical protein